MYVFVEETRERCMLALGSCDGAASELVVAAFDRARCLLRRVWAAKTDH